MRSYQVLPHSIKVDLGVLIGEAQLLKMRDGLVSGSRLKFKSQNVSYFAPILIGQHQKNPNLKKKKRNNSRISSFFEFFFYFCCLKYLAHWFFFLTDGLNFSWKCDCQKLIGCSVCLSKAFKFGYILRWRSSEKIINDLIFIFWSEALVTAISIKFKFSKIL